MVKTPNTKTNTNDAAMVILEVNFSELNISTLSINHYYQCLFNKFLTECLSKYDFNEIKEQK